VVEAVEHGVHGGHTDDVLVGLKKVERALLQKLPLRWLKAVATKQGFGAGASGLVGEGLAREDAGIKRDIFRFRDGGDYAR